MAVTVKKKSLTIVSLLERLFDSEALAGAEYLHKAQELHIQGYKLKTGISAFSIESDAGKTLYSVPLKLDTVTLAMKKKLGATVQNIVKEKIIDLITVSYQKFMDEDPSVPADPSVTGELPPADPEPTPEMTNSVNVEDIKLQQQTVYPVELDLQAAPVLLKDAQKLNQPVCGTSGGSIYHVVAIGQDCVVAVRIKSNNEIAIRAEVTSAPTSEGAMKAASGLKFAGLDKKPAGHWSLHLDPEDFAMVKRSIGSTIMAMSIPFWGVNTDLHTLQGVGK